MLKVVVFLALLFSGVAVYGQQEETTNPPTVVVPAPQERPLPRFVRPEWVIVYVTIIYSGITFFQWWTLRRQAKSLEQQIQDARDANANAGKTAQGTLNAIEKQAESMREQTTLLRQSADAAKQSAEAAKESADVAAAQTKAMTDRERARLYVDTPPIPFHTNFQLAPIGGCVLTIRNVGPTAAINVRGTYSAIATEFETPPEKAPEVRMEIHEVVEGAGKVESEVLVRAAFAKELNSILFWCHLSGLIEYNDVVTDEIRRTKFRFCVPVRLRVNGGASNEGEWRKCGPPEDNKSD